MKAPRSYLAVWLSQQLEAGSSRRAIARKMAAYLLVEGRVEELDLIMHDVLRLRAAKGLVEVTASSAHPISAEDKVDIEDLTHQLQPQSKVVIINESIEPDLIGGVKLRVVDQELDLSVKGRLNLLRQLTSGEVVK